MSYTNNERFLHRTTTVTANDGMWHQICVSWENSLGSWTLYKDGEIKEQGHLKRGHTIREGGSLMLGRKQDSVSGALDATQSFRGMLTNVNVWDHKLTDTGIQEMPSCWLDEWDDGNVFSWRSFLQEAPESIVIKSSCKALRGT